MTKYVYDFAEGGMELKDLLGGKGGNLAEMAKLGLPVPPGFTCAPATSRSASPTRSACTWNGSNARRAAGSATPPIRCWCPCVRGRSSRCRA